VDTSPLHIAVYNRLTGHASSSGKTWAREDQDPGLPFGRVEDLTLTDISAKTADVANPVVQVDFFAADGLTARQGVAAADAAIMDASGGAGTGGYDLSASGLKVIGQPVRLNGGVLTEQNEGEGPDLIRHAYRRYRFTLQDI
jgi:hypothetical protein